MPEASSFDESRSLICGRHLRTALIVTTVFAGQLLAAFQSAPIVLVFPPGARATGLGETFVGLADDANATFYNPAGLGQAPLANSWKTHLGDSKLPYYAIASKRKKEFSLREEIWVGSAEGLLRFNGKAWQNYETHVVIENEDLAGIAGKFLATDDEKIIGDAVQRIRELNNIEMKRFRALRDLFVGLDPDTAQRAACADRASRILDLTPLYRDSSGVAEVLLKSIDSAKVPGVVPRVLDALKLEDKVFAKLVEVKIPFSIAIRDSITDMAVDGSEGLWAGTRTGLWHLESGSWTRITILEGLPSNVITSVAVGPNEEIGVGTDAGIAVLADGAWKAYDLSAVMPADSEFVINDLAFGNSGTVYIGTTAGLVKKQDSVWTLLDTTAGLISKNISSLMYDSEKRLWIGGANGVVIYDETTWRRYKFPQSQVYTFAEADRGKVWIGTNKGAIVYSPGQTRIDDTGKRIEQPPEWKAYHSKNALAGNQVSDIAVHGQDVWIATDKGVSSYDHAEKEVLLFWELLLPALKLKDLYHSYGAFVYPTEEWGTLAASVNFIFYGENTLYNEEGREIEKFTSWDLVLGLSYGLALKQDFSLGLSMKYVHSALVPTNNQNEAVGQTFAVDAALLKRNLLTRGLDIGLNIQNIGPPIYYSDPSYADPLPLTVKLGLAHRTVETPVHELTFLLDLSRELAGNDYEKPVKSPWDGIYYDIFAPDSLKGWARTKDEFSEVQLNTGMEYWYAQFFAIRAGYLFDWVGQRYELTLGLGVKYGNLNFDFSYIHSPEGFMSGLFKSVLAEDDPHREGSYGVRNAQPRISLIFKF